MKRPTSPTRRIYRILAYFTFFISISAHAETASGLTGTVSNVIDNVEEGLKGADRFAIALFYIAGLGLSMSAIYRLKKFGHRTAFMHVDVGIIAPMVQFFIGVALIYSPTFFKVINMTLFKKTSVTSQFTGGSQVAAQNIAMIKIIQEVSGIIQIIGLFAFLRGWLILSRVGKQGTQPGTISKGIVHIIGGILAINIIETINVIVATFKLGGGA